MDSSQKHPSTDDNSHRVDELQQNLYSRGNFHPRDKRRKLHAHDQRVVASDWGGETIKELTTTASAVVKPRWSFAKKIFITSIAFFLLAVSISVFVMLGGSNVVSTDNIDIKIVGPVSVNGGDELSLDVSVINKNNTALELADLVVDYPDGTRSATNLTVEFTKYRESLGDIPAGATAPKTIKAVLFGEENSKKQIKVGVEYRVAGSNAIFYKEKDYTIVISSSPLSLLISSVKEANSGQAVEFTVEVVSNATQVLKNAVFRAEYPFGFSFKSATPDTSYGSTLWRLGDIAPRSKRTIVIRGQVSGQDGEERVFRFDAGLGKDNDDKAVGAVFLSSVQSISIKKPFLGIDLALDGDTSADYVSKGGKNVRVDVLWSNNTSDRITNAMIEVVLDGAPLDKGSISVERGFYRSLDNTIVWDASTVSDFASLEPGASGRLGFSFSSRPSLTTSGPSFNNPNITLSAKILGERMGISGTPEPVNSVTVRNVKITSDLLLASAIVYSTGAFKNTGPVPPKVDTETTYTVIWSLSNSSNAVTGTRVSTILPSYVRWMGQVSPTGETVSYNPVGGEVIWDAGDILAGAGFSKNRRQVAFQIAVTPSLSQLGGVPKLTSDTVASGIDSFTNTLLKDIKNGVTTKLSTDPAFRNGFDVVQK